MFLGRVPTRTFFTKVGLVRRAVAVKTRTIPRVHDPCVVRSLSPVDVPVCRIKAKWMECEIQCVSISCDMEKTIHLSDDDCVGSVKESEIEDGLLIMTTGVVDAPSNEPNHGSVETLPAQNEGRPSQTKTTRKMRQERRKLMKKKLPSAENSTNVMSELPFALASSSAWKELGFSNPESPQRKRKRGDNEGLVDSEEDAEKKKKPKEKQRPNYFVSIPITNAEISSAVVEVQEAVLQQEPRLAKAMIPAPTLHITLLVTHLASQEQVDLAAAALTRAEPSLAKLLGGQGLTLSFSGISHFRKEVVFVGLTPGRHQETLESLAELLRRCFEDEGILQGDGRGFEPHLTIMKLSRAPKLRSQGIKRVDPALYSNYTDRFFGDQRVDRVDLCSMLKKKQQNGYYYTESSLQLGGHCRYEPDEAELLRVSKRLVEDAVNRALQQYKQETLQNGGGPTAAVTQPPDNSKENTYKANTTANTTTDTRK